MIEKMRQIPAIFASPLVIASRQTLVARQWVDLPKVESKKVLAEPADKFMVGIWKWTPRLVPI